MRALARRFPRAIASAAKALSRFSKAVTTGPIPTTRNSIPSAFAHLRASRRSLPPYRSAIATAKTRRGPIASAQSLAMSPESPPPLSPTTTPFRPLSRTEWTMNAWRMKTCSSLKCGTSSATEDGTCVAGINPCGTRSLYRGSRVRRALVNANEATLVWVDEYSRMAEAYDQNVAPRFEPIAQEVVRLADPKANELFLDVGTGTGLLACLLAPRVLPQGVVAIDLADGAISVASYRAGNAGIRNIRFEMLDSRNIVSHGTPHDGDGRNPGITAPRYDRGSEPVHQLLKPS